MLREPLHHFQLPSFPLDTNEKKKTLSLSPSLSQSFEIFLAKSRSSSPFVSCELHLSSFCFAVMCEECEGGIAPCASSFAFH